MCWKYGKKKHIEKHSMWKNWKKFALKEKYLKKKKKYDKTMQSERQQQQKHENMNSGLVKQFMAHGLQ